MGSILQRLLGELTGREPAVLERQRGESITVGMTLVAGGVQEAQWEEGDKRKEADSPPEGQTGSQQTRPAKSPQPPRAVHSSPAAARGAIWGGNARGIHGKAHHTATFKAHKRQATHALPPLS